MNLIEVDRVVKQYAAHRALDAVSLSIPQGTIYGLLGPNGAGKTSLIRMITRITAPDEGEIRFLGEPLQEKHLTRMGYLPEERGLYKKMKVGEQLVYLSRLKGLSEADAKQRLKAWFERFDISAWWNKTVEDLSKGMQQKVQFIATVVHEPELIILDEPFTGFDPINANLVKEEILRLKAQGATIIFSTHRMESVEQLCDHIALINRSRKVLEGPTFEVKRTYGRNAWVFTTSSPIQLPEHVAEVVNPYRLADGSWNSLIEPRMALHPNELLSLVLPQTEVLGFARKEPSINEIFIRAVKESSGEEVVLENLADNA